MTIPPHISDLNEATAVVTAEAGNPQVGFDPVVSSVYNSKKFLPHLIIGNSMDSLRADISGNLF